MSWREALKGRREQIADKRMTVGFDGFIDTIVRPLCQAASADQPAKPFSTIRQFGEFLVSKAEKSCSIELSVEARQLGGNLPFLSRAAGGLGVSVSCIGMLGENGKVDPLFAPMPCTLYPFAGPGQSTCMEFDDGKVLLASDCQLGESVWQRVLEQTGGRAAELFAQADLLALVNWSELSFSQELWNHTLAALTDQADKQKYAFFDLCDISRKRTREIQDVLQLLGKFARYRTVILSLNENEALGLGERLLQGKSELETIAQQIRENYGIDEVVIHTIHRTLLDTSRGQVCQPTQFVEHPRISTGAGDNLNGAFCFATVMGLQDEERVSFANEFAHYYIVHGKNPSLDQLWVK